MRERILIYTTVALMMLIYGVVGLVICRDGRASGATTQDSTGDGGKNPNLPVRSSGFLFLDGHICRFESEYWGDANPEAGLVPLPGSAPMPWLDANRKAQEAKTFDQLLECYAPESRPAVIANRTSYEKSLSKPHVPDSIRIDVLLVMHVHLKDTEFVFVATQPEIPPRDHSKLEPGFLVAKYEKVGDAFLMDNTKSDTMLVTDMSIGRITQFGAPDLAGPSMTSAFEDVVLSPDSYPLLRKDQGAPK